MAVETVLHDQGGVEIAYSIVPAFQGRGYATEAAQALVAYAFGSGRVRLVRAQTAPRANASTRVLTKCGFNLVGDVVDAGTVGCGGWRRSPQRRVRGEGD